MSAFEFRGLELHSSRMWQWAQVERALDFAEKFGLTSLIFHQNDIQDELVFPLKYFDDALMWKRWPVRMHSIYQNRHYINKVVREARRRDIDFFFEVKEITFVDELLELLPHLRAENGAVCPTDPFWWDFLDLKYSELLDAVPDFTGLIVSPGTRESKVSLAAGACTCARCGAANAVEWYRDLLGAIHRPLSRAGKTLAVRDFSYSAEHQGHIIDAATRVSNHIIVSLKNTPHDYYPTFPDNPKIGHTGSLRQWVEYDTWGQFFGLGVFPVSVVEDMQERMHHARACGVSGIALRTDWEVITDAGALNSPNVLNVIGGALLAKNPDRPLKEIYEAWFQHGFYSPMRAASELGDRFVPHEEGAGRLKRFMKASWQVMEKAAYVRGHVFHEDDQYCDTVDKGFAMMVDIHGRDEWEPGASRVLVPTDENIAAILAEKEEAVAEVGALRALLCPSDLGVPDGVVDDLNDMLDLYELWVRGFDLAAKATFLTRRAQESRSTEDARQAEATIAPLREFAKRIEDRLWGTSYPHYVYWIMDGHRLRALAQDVSAICCKLSSGHWDEGSEHHSATDCIVGNVP